MAYCPNSVCPQPQNESTARFCQTCGTPLVLKDRYRLISLLGQGGFGRTFLAESLAPAAQKRCVIKQLHSKSLSASLDFVDEAERLRRLGEHPQIPRLLDSFETQSSQFLVQEFAPGDNLQQQVEARGPWDESAVSSLLKSLIVVLQYVHSFQIIHRDIKPANIVMPAPGGAIAAPMLVDFGSAKWVTQSPANTVIGSAGYASPEQSMGQATFASDIYSLGLTCLHLLTGIHPFALYSAAEDRWVWQDYLTTPLEPKLAQVLDKMVRRSLQQRYETAEQVALDLQVPQSRLMQTQQLVERATESVSGLKQLLKTSSTKVSQSKSKSTSQVKAKSPSQAKLQTKAPLISPVLAQSWQRRQRLASEFGLTQTLAVSNDGQLLASGGSDGSLRLWHLPSAQLLHTFARRRLVGTGHQGAIAALTFHPDNRALYSASEDGSCKEWDAREYCLLNTLPVAGWTPSDLAVTPDGTQLISANRDGKIAVWDIASLLPVAQLTQHQQSVNAIAVVGRWTESSQPSGYVLASASDDGTVKLWAKQQMQQGQSTGEKPQEFQLAKTVNLRRDRNGNSNKSLKDVRAIALTLRLTAYNAYQLIVATSAGMIMIYDLNEHLDITHQKCLHQYRQSIRAIALDPNSNCLAVGTEDRVLTLWQLNAGVRVAQLAHDWGVSAIAFTPNGKSLITASDDEVISLWQRES